MRAPRMCQRFYCDRRGDRYCCRDCPRSIICANPCMNHPARCGLEDKVGRVRPTEVRPVHAVDLWGKE